MEPSFDVTPRKESDVYRMDEAYGETSGASSSDEDFVEEMYNDNGIDHFHLSRQQPQMQQLGDKTPQTQNIRPPPISTRWSASIDEDDNGQEVEVVADEQGQRGINNARVSFNVPANEQSSKGKSAAVPMPSSSRIHFQNPKRHNSNFTRKYPTQSLRSTDGSAADSVLEELVEDNKRTQIGLVHKTPIPIRNDGSSSLAEVTPAFLRRAAQDLGVTANISSATSRHVNSNLQGPVPPNSLMNRRERPATSTSVSSSIPDSSFYGADASALDGTFVSIRDLNDDDDVPSVDNDQWNSSTIGRGETDADFPTESSSLLGRKQMPWQGGFFGSQMEKEDRRERRKIMRAREGRMFSRWLWTLRYGWDGLEKNNGFHANGSRGAQQWETNHPIGVDFMAQRDMHTPNGGLARQRLFSIFLIGVLCLHMVLSGLHDLFLQYLAYRNPEDEGEASVSWNGEGQYVPAYWTSFEGRVLNPFVGPGARTLTAFGALVPGLVLSKGHGWRIATSMFETSSFVQLILHIWALKTAVGGSTTGLEWKRGTFAVALLYVISALIGLGWSMALEPGRLVTASGMGVSGVLAASIVERACFPPPLKDEDNEADIGSTQNGNGSGSNGVTSSSDEQFSFQPPNFHKKKRRTPLIRCTPALILLLELLSSWWAAYASLPGTAIAAMAGTACALLLFAGNPLHGNIDINAHQDLLFNDTPPPPPPPRFAGADIWRGDDDDSADTSIGSDKQRFNTPLMRRSIMADEDDEEEPLGMRSTLRKRNVNGHSPKTHARKGGTVYIKNKKPFSASRIIARVIGVLLAVLLTLIPASLIATGEDPSSELTRATVLGCKPMRILYREDESSDFFECAGGCIPLSRERIARRKEGMKAGRCDTIGYRCWQQSGTMTLKSYDANVGIYVLPSGDGSCSSSAEDAEYNNNDDAGNDEVEGVQ
mmetsp:Transcript_25522/g.61370  ORF Transcript_25522/g.61370 Transcript_25522/m.61370 type:complete len:936 (-) Transcript_25522:310-3117(-)